VPPADPGGRGGPEAPSPPGERELARVELEGDCTVDFRAWKLLVGGHERKLEPKAFHVLRILIEGRPDVVPQERLMELVWPREAVQYGNLAKAVSGIRRALGDDAQSARFVTTTHRVGYAFVGTVAREEWVRAATLCWIQWEAGEREEKGRVHTWPGAQRPLPAGDYVLGNRVGSADILVAAHGVSRRHARLVVGADGVFVHDLGSKNGTFLREKHGTDTPWRRLTGEPARVHSGNQVGLGPVVATIYVASDEPASEATPWTAGPGGR
jgi:DNA-binding winged helix-turn-helix (wHTH) protein